MILDTPVERLIKILIDTYGGIYHPQSLIDYCVDNKIMVIWIQALPTTGVIDNPTHVFDAYKARKRISKYLNLFDGVLTGKVNNHKHAVAWYNKELYDPNGTIYDINLFAIENFFIIIKP